MSYITIPPIKTMENAFSVAGYNVVITGGNRGIGSGISTAFAQSGANVCILCRNKESGDAMVEKLSEYGGSHTCIACDLGDLEQVKAAASQIFEFFDHVDVIVNNAGIHDNCQFLDPEGMSEFQRMLDVNLVGPAGLIYNIAPKMIEYGKGGAIINISSAAAITVASAKGMGGTGYCASKAAQDQFTRHLAVTLGDYGIRVNGINPGPTHSNLEEFLPEPFVNMVENELPAHRFGEPLEIGALCVFLSCPASSQIRGINCRLDGGLTLIQ